SGSASLEAWGGAGEIEINWGGVNPEELFPGVYSVEISDENNCSVLLEFEMISIEPITAEVSVLNANDGNNGSALVTPSGGQPPYDYLWSTGSIFATVNGLGQGTYTCTITDDIGCEIVVEVVIIDTQVNTVARELSALYPNPFSDYLIVPAAACRGELKDLAGRTVVSSIFGGSKSRIDTSALSPGLYLWVSDAGKQLLIKE
ncbi:MAG: hypothetical protein JNM00_07475, partial [Flavobacteriales bacterium]|nr:hypothetical protein [Flavobacteriales bacterium]